MKARDFLRSTIPGPRKSKFGNVKCIWNGEIFDSKGEMDRYEALCWLQAAGKISDLKRQVRFQLCPPVKLEGERAACAVNYIADFAYNENGKRVVEDFKGFQTKDFKIKRRLLKHIHGIDLRLSGRGKNA